jgi:hypothetical protein
MLQWSGKDERGSIVYLSTASIQKQPMGRAILEGILQAFLTR